MQAVMMQRRYRYREMNNRLGVVYQISETGNARLIFTKDRASFKGLLETTSGETISLSGRLTKDSSLPTTSSGKIIMDVFIVDGETGSSFRVENVVVQLDGNAVVVDHPVIQFSSIHRLIGIKANVAIQQYMHSDFAISEPELFVGPMKIQLLASHKPEPSIRRTSMCENNPNTVIIEQSDDFLA